MPFRTPNSSAVYCDLLALQDTMGGSHSMSDTMVWFNPGSACDLSNMNQRSRAGFTCQMQGGQAIIPVKGGFGGWAMYSCHLFMNSTNISSTDASINSTVTTGCRHDERGGGCEHWSLNECIGGKGGKMIIATDLVVNWEGCDKGDEWRLDINAKKPVKPP